MTEKKEKEEGVAEFRQRAKEALDTEQYVEAHPPIDANPRGLNLGWVSDRRAGSRGTVFHSDKNCPNFPEGMTVRAYTLPHIRRHYTTEPCPRCTTEEDDG
jgi:hypothetical protein